MRTFNTGAPQGCVLSYFLYSLFTHDCVAFHNFNTIIKFATDTAVVGLTTGDDESTYREEVSDYYYFLSLNMWSRFCRFSKYEQIQRYAFLNIILRQQNVKTVKGICNISLGTLSNLTLQVLMRVSSTL